MSRAIELLVGISLLILFLPSSLGQSDDGQVHGFISFSLPELTVSEETSEQTVTVEVPLVRQVGTTGRVLATVAVVNATANEDFFRSSVVVFFEDGESTANADFVLFNDNIPEGNETFLLAIMRTELGAEIGAQNTMRLVVTANDEPHGQLGFSQSSMDNSVAEPSGGNVSVTLTIIRGPGVFGQVSVDFEVVDGPNLGIEDIFPTQGLVVFPNEISSQTVVLYVFPDDLPEGNETFTLRLSNPEGGATLAEGSTDALITILENDTPISFTQAVTGASEEAGLVDVVVTRGLLENGVQVGDLTVPSTVQYATMDGTATAGTDYVSQSDTITFSPGETSRSLSIQLINDETPEGDEDFIIVLSNPSEGTVLHPLPIATVVIDVSDNAGGLVQFASTEPVVVGEDDGGIARFTVRRTIGNFSDLTIAWQVTESSTGELATADFQPPQGNVTIPDGQFEAVLEIQPFNDASQEVAEVFMVELVGVVDGEGQLNEEGVRIATLIVADSDDVYGLVEWAEDESLLQVTSTSPRELHLAIARSGISIGIIAVNYSITYLPVGTSDPSLGDSSPLEMARGSVQLVGGQTLAEFTVMILEDAFLEPGANFYAYINTTALVGGVPRVTQTTNSPQIGPRRDIVVTIPATAANGYIGFSPGFLQRSVSEPESGLAVTQLEVIRTGAYGQANVTWQILLLPGTNISDIGSSSGVAYIADGMTSTTIDVDVVADEEPEVDEFFLVQLVSVVPSNQRILDGQNESTIIILTNDDAEGRFFINETTLGPFVVQESSFQLITVIVQREGGALTSEVLRFTVLPSEQPSDFFGGSGFVSFQPGQRQSDPITLLAQDDSIPENDELFMLEISATGLNEDIVRQPSSVNITILANDDYAGVFSFASTSLDLTIDEPASNGTQTPSTIATFTIERGAGTFTNVIVDWAVVTEGSEADITPTSGKVEFAEDQQTGSFEIRAKPDEIPEQAELFTVVLTLEPGDARIADDNFISTLTVRQNDDPINFNGSFVEVREGETAVFSVVRGGQANGIAEVSFSIVNSSANITVLPEGILVFQDGQTEAQITVYVFDDEIPEESEIVTIHLDSTTGDAVIVSPDNATLLIRPSDDPNGVFVFAEGSRDVALREGDTQLLYIERQMGMFGTVILRWTVYQVDSTTGQRYTDNITDISPSTNLVYFFEGNASEPIVINVLNDVQPELEEVFEVDLEIVTVLGDSADGARLGTFNVSRVTVAESDDPYGLFRFDNNSMMIELAEDAGEVETAVRFGVERTFGTLGEVQVTWEILPQLDEPLPPFTDLLFLGNQGPGLSTVQPRNGTGTIALQFPGTSLVTLPEPYQPDTIVDEFTISLWLQPAVDASGVLVAKSSGSTTFYSLSLVADVDTFILRLSYLPSSQQSESSSVEASLPLSSLLDGVWHSLAVSVGAGRASFYADGSLVASRNLIGASIADGVGQVTVGGLNDGQFYTGLLQDVRIYTYTLTASQVAAIGTDSASSDVTPISGYLTFPSAVTRGEIAVNSLDDNTPEPSKFFTVQLTSSNGGSRIERGEGVAYLTVLKSDAGNGIFGFSPIFLSNRITEPGTASLPVNRERGSFEIVRVYWEVREGDVNGSLATDDFVRAMGYLEFLPEVTQQNLTLVAIDELVPELSEDFAVLLLSAEATDNQTSSTPSSGASINASLALAEVTISENDYPYGLLQFVISAPLPGEDVPPAGVMPEVFVEESVGSVTVYVVRAQGNLGTASAEYFTVDGSASSVGVNPDFVPSAGTVTFGPSDQVQSVTLTLQPDDDLAELGKVFYVELTNPTGSIGSPGLDIGSRIAINILPSDDAFGVFAFSPESLSVVVSEEGGEAGTPVFLTVTRGRGTFGNVTVYWEAEGEAGAAEDISPRSGFVMFAEDVTEKEIEVTVVDEMVPELLERFTITLLNVSGGARLSSSGDIEAVVTVEANDHPYGLFVFSSAYRPLVIDEGVGLVEVRVNREFGKFEEVRVQFQTIHSDEAAISGPLTGINVEELMLNSQLATTGVDYVPAFGDLIFAEEETSRSFNITVLQDDLPELDEFIFVSLTGAQLVDQGQSPPEEPLIPPGNESLAFIVIGENDDAHGIISFTRSVYETEEPSQDFLLLSRTAGTFGTVSVQWEATPNTASTSDFTPSADTVSFAPGENSTIIPLSVLDDDLAEFQESFVVRLVGIDGGARMDGGGQSAVVNILASDDPNGAVGFAPGSRMVPVSEEDTPVTVSLTVERTGGTEGVIEVSWTLRSNDGSDASLDIVQLMGTVPFVSEQTEQFIVLSVLPDTIPEITESFTVELVSAVGGARIINETSVAVVQILPNDNPYGVVSLATSTFAAVEADNDTVAMVPIIRSLGTFGDLLVTFSVQSADIATLATADGTLVLDFFSTPVPDTALPGSALLSEPAISPTIPGGILNECARLCLSNEACMSFSSDDTAFCQLYHSLQATEGAIAQTGAGYYEKDVDMVEPFADAVASAGTDFRTNLSATITIPEGSNGTAVPVTIIGDTIPELNESLIVTLSAVEVVGGSIEPSATDPILGDITKTTVVILESDDPYGRFFLFVGSSGDSELSVPEAQTDNLGITLIVERQGGMVGDVQITWAVIGGIATEGEGEDYIGDGAVLTFPVGTNRRPFPISILGDSLPERDEDILIALLNPTGGAVIADGDGGTVRIVIEANDNAAGIVQFPASSRSVVLTEGEVGRVPVERVGGALGVVQVNWEITGPGNVGEEFSNTSGVAFFEEGFNVTEIDINVRADATPEISEPYTLTLTSVETLSSDISPSGHAVRNPQGLTAVVTIQANENPHGVVEFQAASANVSSSESVPVELTLVRKFGTIGAIEVHYVAVSGGLSPASTPATPGEDFDAQNMSIVLGDGQQSTVIVAPIIDDSDAELAEVFLVRLISVTFAESFQGNTDVPPSIGGVNTTQVTIDPNDSPQGEFTFTNATFTVDEDIGEVVIDVIREQGTEGLISVVYTITGDGATHREDFDADTIGMLLFRPGDKNMSLIVDILSDDDPEVDESFCIQLTIFGGEGALGRINMTCVTILANDDAYGVFSFEPSSLFNSLTEAEEITTSENVAELLVVRRGGLFGRVFVPVEVEEPGRDDLSPATEVLVFDENEMFKVLPLEAVRDTISELDETYSVSLLPPLALGRLATTNTTATVTILANQDPFGVLEIFPVNSSMSSVQVEEGVAHTEFEVRRSFGDLSEVSVTVVTAQDSAQSPEGNSLALSTVQLLETVSAHRWYQFTSSTAQQYLVLAGGSHVALYAWRGVFTSVQTIPVSGVSSFAFLSVEGRDLLVASNAGSPGNREVNSTVYQLNSEGQLEVLQLIPTVGASDVVAFQSPIEGSGDWYLVLSAREDSEGSPNVDSLVLRWNGMEFQQTQTLATIGASALDVFSISGTIYLAVASQTDTRSSVYIWLSGETFRLHQTFNSEEAVDVVFISFLESSYLTVASRASGVDLLLWVESGQFVPNATLAVTSPTRVEIAAGFLVVTTDGSPGRVFLFQGSSLPTEVQTLSLPASTHLYPFTLSSQQILMAQATTEEEQSLISEIVYTDFSLADYHRKNFTLTFAVGESSHRFVVDIIDDVIPEVGEGFSVGLEGPVVGGARLGDQQSIDVTILTNDDAHGRIGFAPSSLSVIAQELDFQVPVVLDVVREGGAFGEVRVEWVVTGEHAEGEVTSTSTTVIFPDGISNSTINLFISTDEDPELSEVTRVMLTEITENGVPPGGDPTRGAQLILSQTVAVVTVQANDAPHGVVAWPSPIVLATENEGVDTTVELTVIREFGFIGAILITYSTQMATSFPLDEQAVQGQDYIPSTSTIVMADGETSANISLTILHDDIPELVETFLVTITNVQLVDESVRQNSTSDSPRTEPGQESVQVQIVENDNTRGVLHFADSAVSVEENAGSVSLRVVRSGGTFGEVGVEFVSAGLSAVGGGVDFSTASGIVRLGMNVQEAEIVVNITNDLEPELEETFTVTLTRALMGSQLGNLTTVTVTILRNDDINGVFSFADNSLLLLIPESQSSDDPLGTATLVVQRRSNFVGTVTVYWEVSEDGRADLEPASGNVTFAEDETEKSFQVRAIGDGVPELFESYLVRLVAIDGGGRIGDPNEARIAIQASDDPSGVIGFEDYPQGIIIDEGDELVFKMLRTAGLGGTVSATWTITPGDITVFVSTSDTVFFADGQDEATVTVQTISDPISEVARLFSLRISSTNLARADLNSSQVDVIVTASDTPHGVVQFAPPLVLEILEAQTVLYLPIQRTMGLVGALRVNFTVVQSGAMMTEDFIVLNQTAVIPGDAASALLVVEIINDETPELDESFSVTLDSVELAEDINGGRDFEFTGDTSLIDQPPLLGITTEIEVRILANDDPYGTINLSDSTYRVNEGETAVITLVRSGGAFGAASISYSFQMGSASGADFMTTGEEVLFVMDQSTAEIAVVIVDDTLGELQEDFSITVSLTQPSTTGPQLGTLTTATIIIESSDSPFGKVGFSAEDAAGIVLNNPTVDDGPEFLSLRVDRTDGLIGTTQVTWEVVGPYPGREGEDIDQTTIQGTLTLNEGQVFGFIQITVLPSAGPEPEETFTITLTDASNNVEVAPDSNSVSIIVLQRGMPYGVLGFIGDALDPRFVSEPENFSLPIVRTGEALGNVQVLFEVTGLGSPEEDLKPVNGSVMFSDGQYEGSVMLQVLDDSEPELEETYTVTLTQALGGATLNELATVSTFTIRSNDAPYGRFAISSPLVSVSSSLTRSLSFNVTRELGSMGTVAVEVSVVYDPNPGVSYLMEALPLMYTFADGETESSFSLTVNDGVFLSPFSTFTVSITRATLTPQGIPAEISSTFGSVQVTVTEEVSNALIGFDQASLEATITDGAPEDNVALTITRSGQLGVVLVTWATGLPGGSVANGSIVPASGSVLMGPEDSSTVIELTAVPRVMVGTPEVFAVRLSAASTNPSLPAQVDPDASIAIVEPQGVLQLGAQAFSGVEGTQVTVTVWRRYGSMGDVTVSGVAMVASSDNIPANQIAAQGGVDFSIVPVSTILQSGETVGELVVPLPVDNAVSGPPKVFLFSLTEVNREPQPQQGTPTSPRLSSDNTTSVVTIIDDETIFSLLLPPSTSPSVVEGDSITVVITRSGWIRGSVTLVVRTMDGWTNGSTPDSQTAEAATGDYVPVAMEITLADNETSRTLEVRTGVDLTPELTEYFAVILDNPPGGLAYINPLASSIDVAISASNNPLGIFSLTPSLLALTEDETPSGTIIVLRSPGLLGDVSLTWEVVPAIGTFVVERDTIIFGAGETTATIPLQLQTNVDSGDFVLRISSSAEGVAFGVSEASITVVGKRSATFQFNEQNRTVIATGDSVTLVVERVDGDRLSAQVTYSTLQPTANQLPVVAGELTFNTAAIPGTHYASVASSFPLTFEPSDQIHTITINILSTAVTRPVVFFVNIEVNSPHFVQNSQATVVIYPRGTLSSLFGLYFDVLIAENLRDLEVITSGLLGLLQEDQVSGRNAQQSDTVRYIIDNTVSRSSAINTNTTAVTATRRKRYTDLLKDNVLDIFEEIISNQTFSGMSRFVQSLQAFAYSLLDGRACPYNTTETRPSYYLETLRLRPSSLYGRRFSAEVGGDFLQYPSESVFRTEPTSECLDVHYIEFFEERLFESPTLRSKVLSTGIRGFSLPTTQNPITYRIYANEDVGPTIDEFCLLWQYPSSDSAAGAWITKSSDGDQICKAKASLVIQEEYIECECDMLGDFAASEDVVDLGYGWTFFAPISCAFVMVAIALVVIIHFVYFRRTQLITRIFIMFCIAIFFFQLVSFVDALAASEASTDGCTAIGIILHLTMIAQFVWMLALGVALWTNFMGFTDDRGPLIVYIVICWSVAIVVVIATLIIGNFVGELDVGDGELYGEVPDNGDICFMPELSAGLLSSMLPVMIAILAIVALFSHSCVYWSRWEDYHNFYYDSFNKTEIPLLLVFFALVFLSWLLGGVHMYIREVYTFALFVAFNIFEGIYALIVYFFISWHTLTRKHKKYGMGDEVEPLTVPEEPDYLGSISTLASSRQQLIPQDEWEDDDHVPPVVPLGVKRVSSEPSVQPSVQSGDDSQLDDLMFMLKTQTYPHDEEEEQDYPYPESPRRPSASEHLELRRISIADTHL